MVGTQEQIREHKWTSIIPTKDAINWHCKYYVKAEEGLAGQGGYVYIEAEQYGFMGDVYLIVQPRGQFYDFSIENPVNDVTKVFKAQFGSKFLVPAEYDSLISFAPIKRGQEPTTYLGKFRFRTSYQSTISE